MPSFSETNKSIFSKLKHGYETLVWYKRLYFPHALRVALNEYNSSNPSLTQALAICNAILRNTWFFQRWIYSCLAEFNESSLIRTLREPDFLFLLSEGEAGLANFNAMLSHPDPGLVADALYTLHMAGLLTDDEAGWANRNAVSAYQYPFIIADALRILHTAGILTDNEKGRAYRTAVMGRQDAQVVARVLVILHKTGLSTGESAQANFNALMTYSDILLGEGVRTIWARFPLYQLDQERFRCMIEIVEQHRDNPQEGQAAFLAYLNQRLNQAVSGGGEPQVNNPSPCIHRSNSADQFMLQLPQMRSNSNGFFAVAQTFGVEIVMKASPVFLSNHSK